MPSRTAPRLEYASIGRFIGMKNSVSIGVDRKPGHFDLLTNVYADVDRLIKRNGVDKTENFTHATGNRTYGAHYLQGYTGTDFTWAKITEDDLYFYNAVTPAFNRFTGHAFPSTDTYFVEMNGFKDNNNTYNISETVKAGSTATNVMFNSGTGPWPDNFLAGTVARFTHSGSNIEYKIIAGNYYDGTNDHIIFNDEDPLNGVPATGIAIKIHESKSNLYIGGGSEYARIDAPYMAAGVSGGTSSQGYVQLNTIQTSITACFTGIVAHVNRVFGWKDNVVRFSDLYNGDNFGKQSYFKFPSVVRACVPFGDNILVIYEARRTWALIGIAPSTWELRLIHENIGSNYPKTIANYASTSMNIQIFVASDGQVRVITSDTFRAVSREVRIDSVSKDYINEEFTDNGNYVCAGVDNEGRYHVFRGSLGEFWTLNVRASERMGFREWAWSKNQLANTAIVPYIAVRAYGYLHLGAVASGQLYIFNADNDDDGTAIPITIRRRGLNFDALGDRTKFAKIQVAQGPSKTTTTMTVKAEASNSTAGTISHTIMTYDPSTGDKLRKGTIPNNPTNQEGTGQMLDYEITESGSEEVAAIEQINFGYRPSVLI